MNSDSQSSWNESWCTEASEWKLIDGSKFMEEAFRNWFTEESVSRLVNGGVNKLTSSRSIIS